MNDVRTLTETGADDGAAESTAAEIALGYATQEEDDDPLQAGPETALCW